MDRSRVMRPVPDAVQRTDGPQLVIVGPVCLRSRRPAIGSPALMTSKRSVKRSTRPSSSSVHYQYDHSKGFIVRTNQDVYRASNFRKPVPASIGVQILDIKGTVGEESSPGTSPESPKKEHRDNTYDDITPVPLDRKKLPPIVSELKKEDEKPMESHLQSQKTQMDSERTPANEVPKGPESDVSKKPVNDNEPKRELMVQRLVPPTVISARKQQIERAKRIRQVTSAVQVIQGAYRRYLWRKTKRIQPVRG